jgi:hypothetical protein
LQLTIAPSEAISQRNQSRQSGAHYGGLLLCSLLYGFLLYHWPRRTGASHKQRTLLSAILKRR